MLTSEFIPVTSEGESPENAEPLASSGATCLTYKVKRQGRWLFMKQLRPEFAADPRYRAAFDKEYRTGSALSHPHLVQYLGYDDQCLQPYILQEYVDGMTLTELLQQRPDYFASQQRLLRFVRQLLQVLGYLHSHRIVHLDIKPDNLMITRVGEELMLLDLGFCYTDAYDSTMGRTDEFAAPEQLRPEVKVDARTDLYVVGRLLFYIEQYCPEVTLSRRLQHVASRAMHPDPNRRYPTADEMLDVLSPSILSRLSKAFFALCIMLFAVVTIFFRCHPDNWTFDEDDVDGINSSSCDFEVFSLGRLFHFHILSADSLTCEVTRHMAYRTSYNYRNIFVPSEVEHEGKRYRVTRIGTKAFYGCDKMTTIDIPASVTSLGAHALANCERLANLKLPDRMDTIESNALLSLPHLTRLTMPVNLRHIPPRLMVGTTALRQVMLPDSLLSIGFDAFVGSGITEIDLPEGMTELQRGVFYSCKSLRRVTLPSTLRNFGEYIFWHCDSLLEVRNLSPVPQRITDIFQDSLQSRRTLYVPEASIPAYREAPYWRSFGQILPL